MNTHYIKIILILLLLSFSFSEGISFPQENLLELKGNWYQVTSWVEIHEDMTSSQAKENAINQALKTIIEFHSGIKINSTSLSILAETNLEMDLDHFSQIINSMSTGIILEKKIIENRKEIIDGYLIYIITLQAKVGQLKGEKDPFFKIEAHLNRDNFQNGDEMIIDISTTKDCFIFVFNIYGDNTVASLLPNQYMSNNFLQKGHSLQLPSKEGKITKFKVGLSEDQKHATELIMILAIKPDKNSKDKNFDFNMGNYTQTLNELMEFIMLFDKNQIEQVNLPYVIMSKKRIKN